MNKRLLEEKITWAVNELKNSPSPITKCGRLQWRCDEESLSYLEFRLLVYGSLKVYPTPILLTQKTNGKDDIVRNVFTYELQEMCNAVKRTKRNYDEQLDILEKRLLQFLNDGIISKEYEIYRYIAHVMEKTVGIDPKDIFKVYFNPDGDENEKWRYLVSLTNYRTNPVRG